LKAGSDAAVEEGVGGGGWVVAEDVGGFVGEHEGVEVSQGGGGVLGEAGKGGDVGWIFEGKVVGLGEVVVGGVEGVPDGVGEGIGRRVCGGGHGERVARRSGFWLLPPGSRVGFWQRQRQQQIPEGMTERRAKAGWRRGRMREGAESS